ncbi:hypothetical protein CEXT_762232, partial [Caerostris extrusa]
VECDKLLDFKEHFTVKNIKGLKPFKLAVQEALTVLASRHHYTFDNPSSLLEWANSGFQTDINVVSTELPDIVLMALQRSQEMDAKDEIYICIMCCMEEPFKQHPLFNGGVCKKCTRYYYDAIVSLTVGEMTNICVVCGEGGQLIYCSSSTCLR